MKGLCLDVVFQNFERVKEIVASKPGVNEASLEDLRILITALELAYSVKNFEIFDYIFDATMETMTWCNVLTEDAFDFVWQMVKETCIQGQFTFFENALHRLWGFRDEDWKPTSAHLSELLLISLRNNRNTIAFYLYYKFHHMIQWEGIPEFLLQPIFFWEKMRKKSRNRAQKKIYFWWIPLCYDMSRMSGQRMAEKFKKKMEKMLAL